MSTSLLSSSYPNAFSSSNFHVVAIGPSGPNCNMTFSWHLSSQQFLFSVHRNTELQQRRPWQNAFRGENEALATHPPLHAHFLLARDSEATPSVPHCGCFYEKWLPKSVITWTEQLICFLCEGCVHRTNGPFEARPRR